MTTSSADRAVEGDPEVADAEPADGAAPEAAEVAEVAEPVAMEPAAPDAEPAEPTVPEAAGHYRVVVVSSVTLDLPDQHPIVVLREAESPRRQLSFAVGLQDGIALAQALRRLPTPRPLTHELTSSVLRSFDIDVVAVRLVGRQGSTYFAELDLRGRDRRSVLSCRPSDALALALRQPVAVPVLVDVRLLELSTDVLPPSPTT